LRKEVEELLQKYYPSQLDDELRTTCPFYEQRKNFTSAYKEIHDLGKARVLERLQVELEDLCIEGEIELDYGRVDGGAKKLMVKNEGRYIALIEVKSGGIKLVQPSIYTYLTGVPTLLAELKTGDVHKIDFETAESVVFELLMHIKDKERLRKAGKKVPGSECMFCRRECEYKKEIKTNDPVKNLQIVLGNAAPVAVKLANTIREMIEKEKQLYGTR